MCHSCFLSILPTLIRGESPRWATYRVASLASLPSLIHALFALTPRQLAELPGLARATLVVALVLVRALGALGPVAAGGAGGDLLLLLLLLGSGCGGGDDGRGGGGRGER